MVEERVVEVREPAGSTHTHTTVYEDRPRSSGSGICCSLLFICNALCLFLRFNNWIKAIR